MSDKDLIGTYPASKIMIKFVSNSDILPIRNQVLREGRLTPDECRFPTDDLPGSFHLGYFHNEQLACVVSFHVQNYGEFGDRGYQLRGMATVPEYQSQGLGSQLVNYAIDYLQQQQTDYIWCNARKKAMPFYERLGFRVVSAEFYVPGIGPHYAMYRSLIESS